MISEILKNKRLYRVFVILGLSALLYPLAIRLYQLDYDEKIAGKPHSLQKLVWLVEAQLSREHLIAQVPTSDVQSYGFASEDEFSTYEHALGNLTLLSQSENSRCQNKPLHTKLTDPQLYPRSIFAITRNLAHKYKDGVFKKDDLLKRTAELSNFIIKKYPVWAEC